AMSGEFDETSFVTLLQTLWKLYVENKSVLLSLFAKILEFPLNREIDTVKQRSINHDQASVRRRMGVHRRWHLLWDAARPDAARHAAARCLNWQSPPCRPSIGTGRRLRLERGCELLQALPRPHRVAGSARAARVRGRDDARRGHGQRAAGGPAPLRVHELPRRSHSLPAVRRAQ